MPRALGCYFHLAADLRGSARSLADRFIYGAPVSAPLLFADLAALLGWRPGEEAVAGP